MANLYLRKIKYLILKLQKFSNKILRNNPLKLLWPISYYLILGIKWVLFQKKIEEQSIWHDRIKIIRSFLNWSKREKQNWIKMPLSIHSVLFQDQPGPWFLNISNATIPYRVINILRLGDRFSNKFGKKSYYINWNY